MKLIIEFPMHVVCSYNGASNLDETLDDNITYLIGKYCYDNGIEFKILSMDFVKPKPNINDELIRYETEIGTSFANFKVDWILNELKAEGFDKGLTIKSAKNEVLLSDEYSPDIQFRRKLWNRKKVR